MNHKLGNGRHCNRHERNNANSPKQESCFKFHKDYTRKTVAFLRTTQTNTETSHFTLSWHVFAFNQKMYLVRTIGFLPPNNSVEGPKSAPPLGVLVAVRRHACTTQCTFFDHSLSEKSPGAFVLELYIHTCLCKHIPTPPHVPSSHGRVVPARDFAGDSDSVVVPCAVPSPVACSKNKERQKTDRDSATKPDERTTKEHRSVEFVNVV